MRIASRFFKPTNIYLLNAWCWYWWLWQFQLTGALLLPNANINNNNNIIASSSSSPTATTTTTANTNINTQSQILTPQDTANGAILQALGQFAIQQVAQQQQQQQLSLGAVNNFNDATGRNSVSGGSQIMTTTTNNINQTQIGTNGQAANNNNNQFIIKVIHNDPKNQLAYVSIIPINNTNLHEPRIELRYQSKVPYVSLDEKTANNTVVAAVLVNDEDQGPNGETSLSIEQGNELGHFKLHNTPNSHTILVNGAPLSRHRVAEYNLTIVARDHGSPPKSSSSNLVIKLYQSNTTPTAHQNANYNFEPQPSLKPPVTDLMFVGATLVVIFSALIFLIIIGCALVQRPKNKTSHKGPPPSRPTSATNSRLHSADQCSAYCLTGLTNLELH